MPKELSLVGSHSSSNKTHIRDTASDWFLGLEIIQTVSALLQTSVDQ